MHVKHDQCGTSVLWCRKNVHLRALNDAAEAFNFSADQDFQWSEDPSKKTISYNLLKSTLEDFLGSVSKTNLTS